MADLDKMMREWQAHGFSVEFCPWCQKKRGPRSNALVHFYKCPLQDVQVVDIPVDFETPVDIQAGIRRRN